MSAHLQALITVPTGGWDFTAAATPLTIAAGTYYLTGPSPAQELTAGHPGLLNEFRTQARTVYATLNVNIGATGQITISRSGSNFSITWDDTDLRDCLGFTGASTSGTFQAPTTYTATGANQCQPMWIPGCPVQSLHYVSDSYFEKWRGELESDFRAVEHMSGMGRTFVASAAYIRSLVWPMVARNKVFAGFESLANESWERFSEGALAGRYVWATPGGPIRWQEEAALTGVSGSAAHSYPGATQSPSQYKVAPENLPFPERVSADFGGMWKVSIPRAILIPELFDVWL